MNIYANPLNLEKIKAAIRRENSAVLKWRTKFVSQKPYNEFKVLKEAMHNSSIAHIHSNPAECILSKYESFRHAVLGLHPISELRSAIETPH